ncbi:MAG: hypothetical protein M3R08_09035 [Bacteroidota bacterium]|nr:hypothetical protein [Bacteroidota bacterium]
MVRPYFALFKDPFGPGAHISIYQDLFLAKKARARTGSADAELIRFDGHDRLLARPDHLPIYLAMTMEDDGHRIHGAFDSLMELQTYLMTYSGESPCHGLVGWPDLFRSINARPISYISPRSMNA